MSEKRIDRVWEFRTGVQAANAKPCACDRCTSTRLDAIAERPDLKDDQFVQFDGDTTKYSVRELRAAEGKRHSAQDQVHLDAAALNASKVLDRLHSAGARVPGTSQSIEADIEESERAAETYPPPNGWQIALDLRAAASTPESTHDERARQEREYRAAQERWYAGEADRVAALRAARGLPEPRIVALSANELAKAPDPWAEGLKLLRAADARRLAARESR